MGAFVGVALAIVLGPVGLAWYGATMAGMIGGAVGGAITGGLEGGWKGALIGAGLGGITGGIGGWAIGGGHTLVLAGMFVAGAGVAGATDSWDSFAGGLAGGLAAGGIASAYKQQFANYRAGNGFVSNRDAPFNKFSQEMKTKHALNVNQKDTNAELIYRPLSKNRAGDPGSTTGPRHGAVRSGVLERGKWEMGGQDGIIQTTNTADNLSGWGTHITTEKSLSLGGRYINSFNTQVNGAALQENIALYESTFAGKFSYQAGNHNSNFAVNSVVYGAGGDVPEGVRAPGFPDSP